MQDQLEMIRKYADMGRSISDELARAVLTWPDAALGSLFEITTELARRLVGDNAALCSILSVRGGRCSEDCAFCPQSSHHEAEAERFDLLEVETILRRRDAAARGPLDRFSLVASGLRLSERDVAALCGAIVQRSEGPGWCVSLGCLDAASLALLRDAGVRRYHHNLESGESFFAAGVCTTHAWSQRVETLRAARAAGLELCSGGVFGLGESLDQRVELARALQREAVDCIPLNFLTPIPGTPLAGRETMTPGEILRAIAMVRLVNPAAEIRAAAGRALLGERQGEIFAAGATGMMTGDFLTTSGSVAADDLALLKRLGLRPRRASGEGGR